MKLVGWNGIIVELCNYWVRLCKVIGVISSLLKGWTSKINCYSDSYWRIQLSLICSLIVLKQVHDNWLK